MNGLFSTTFMPHGTCYLWNTGLVSVEVISNLLIGLAYLAITITLLYLVRKTRDIPFEWMYVAFATFIVTCGITHFFDVLVIWIPAYWSDASVRVVTAFASVGTAFLLPPLIPKAITLADSAALAHDRGIEVEKANRELRTLLNKTQELEQQKTQFFANISHELRTPLALILGPAEKLLASATLDPGHRADLQIIESNGQSLLNLVNDLLDISKIEAGKMQPDYAETDVARLMRTVAANFDGLAKERQMEYKVDAAASTSAEVDPDKLQRIVLNLLSNAFKFTPAGGRVRLTARGTPEGLLRLEVADSGPGIPPDQRELIFERFRQLDGGATRHFGGTGLGLAISREFAVLLGGRLWVESAEEGGAMFVLEMPLKAAADVPVGRMPLNGPAENNRLASRPIGEPRAGARSIAGLEQGDSPLALVIEDNPEMNEFICRMLETEYRVVSALDGAEGLARAQELRPDVIVSDVMMPVLSGDQLVRKVREDDSLANIPILLLTARADDELRVGLLEDGAQDYVMKPFSRDELMARVRNLVTMKRVRDVLQSELERQTTDLETLAREVTWRKRELQEAVESMRVARAQAERASKAKSEFLSMVSHELRNPLNALQLLLERIRRDREANLSPTQHAMLARMGNSMNGLADLIESLLEHSRLETGKLVTDIRPLDVNALVAGVVEESRPYAQAKNLELDCLPAEGMPQIKTDERLLRLILVNLISNALKFTDSGGVTIAPSMTADGLCRISVKDTGRGIAPEDRVRIFEPFEQLEAVPSKHMTGIGLGLSLVREMTNALGGRIELDSEPGQGSTFSVTVPSLA